MSEPSKLREIPLSLIRENPVALRVVNKKSEEWPGFVDSIRLKGVLNPISVRQMKDPETGQSFYYVVDGLHRWTGAAEAGLEKIEAKIITANEAETLEVQLMANIHKVETRHHEYGQQLTRILAYNPTMTANELAAKLGMSPTWISQRLSLVKLDPKIGALVDAGEINLSNAYVMTKLPVEEQAHFVDRAMTQPPAEFTNVINTRAKELRDAKREGRAAKPTEFVPMARLRKLVQLKEQADKPDEVLTVVREAGARTPAEIAACVLKWVLHLDDASVEAARAKDTAARAEEEQAKAKRKSEQQAKKEAAAKAIQAGIVAGV